MILWSSHHVLAVTTPSNNVRQTRVTWRRRQFWEVELVNFLSVSFPLSHIWHETRPSRGPTVGYANRCTVPTVTCACPKYCTVLQFPAARGWRHQKESISRSLFGNERMTSKWQQQQQQSLYLLLYQSTALLFIVQDLPCITFSSFVRSSLLKNQDACSTTRWWASRWSTRTRCKWSSLFSLEDLPVVV